MGIPNGFAKTTAAAPAIVVSDCCYNNIYVLSPIYVYDPFAMGHWLNILFSWTSEEIMSSSVQTGQSSLLGSKQVQRFVIWVLCG